ncbi:MAG: LuxR C-terminal-related transcriptional regulator, partial [Chloroflexota bacterium]
RAAVLFVVTARSDELYLRPAILPFLAELERDDQVERLELQPFGRAELMDQLESLLGERPGAELCDEILDRSGGNPFFAEQLLVAAGERGHTRELPPLLRDVLLARIASVSMPARDILRAASAAGRRTDDELLAAVLGRQPSEITAALREVIDRGILVDADGVDDGVGGYAFRHALLREVIYAELFSGERVRLHAAFAQSLSERGEIGGIPVSPAELAYHWDAARDYLHALPAVVAAARAAESVYAFVEARRDYERAIELWDRVPRAPEIAGIDRVSLLQRAAETSVLTGSYKRAIELGRAAIETLRGSKDADPGRLGQLHERLRWFLFEAGDRQEAAAAVAEAIRLIPSTPPSAARARALAQAAGMQLLGGRHRAASELATEALATARQAGARSEEALADGVLGWATAVLGEVDDGIALFREGLAIAEELGGAEGVAIAYTNLSSLLDRVGRTEESLSAARAGFAVTQRLGVARTYGGILLGHAAKALINLGRWDEAAAALDQGLDLDPLGRPQIWLRINQARLDTNRGRFEAAGRELRQARAIDDRIGGSELYRAALLTALAELALWEGRLVDVRAAVTEGLERVRRDEPPDPALAWLAAVALRAEADAAELARARHDDAALAEIREIARAIEQALDDFESSDGRSASASIDDRPVIESDRSAALAAQCRAELHRLDGKREPLEWARIAARWDEVGRPYPAAYARYRQAEALLASRGSREEAERALREADRITDELRAQPLQGQVQLLARQARLDLEPKPTHAEAVVAQSRGDAFGLTDREAEVLQLVAGGWSNQQIADALFISRKTASVHVSNILGKLGAASRVEAAAIAHRLGLEGDAPPPPVSDHPVRPVADVVGG